MTQMLGQFAVGITATLAQGTIDKIGQDGKAAAEKFSQNFKENGVRQMEQASQGIAGAFKGKFTEAGGAAGQAFNAALRASLAGEAGGGFDQAVSAMSGAFDTMESAAVNLVSNLGMILPPGFKQVFEGAIGGAVQVFDSFKGPAEDFLVQLTEIGAKYLDASRMISRTTLELEEIPKLLTSVRDVMATGNIVEFDDVADSIGRLNVAIGELSTTQLEELISNFAMAEEVLGQIDDVKLAGAINAWNVPAADATEALRVLANTARITGEPINMMLTEMTDSGPAMRAFGYSMTQTGEFFAKMRLEGIPAQRSVFMMTSALREFTEQGRDPKEAFKGLLDTIKQLASGTDAEKLRGRQLVQDYFGQRGSAVMFEAIQKGLVKTADQMEAFNRESPLNASLKQAVQDTMDMGDAFEAVKLQIEAALAPIGLELAGVFVGLSQKMTPWLEENGGQIMEWASTITNTILGMFGDATKFFADILSFFGPAMDVAKSIVFGGVESIMGFFQPFIAAMSALPGRFGAPFKSANEIMSKTRDALNDLQAVDITKSMDKFNELVTKVTEEKLPRLQERISSVAEDMAAHNDLNMAFKQEINGERQSAFDMVGQGTDPNAPPALLRIMEGANVEAIKENLRRLGISIALDAQGIVTSVTTTSDKARKDWEKWLEQQTIKKLELQAVNPDGDTVDDVADLIPTQDGTVEVEVRPRFLPGIVMPGQPVGPGQIPWSPALSGRSLEEIAGPQPGGTPIPPPAAPAPLPALPAPPAPVTSIPVAPTPAPAPALPVAPVAPAAAPPVAPAAPAGRTTEQAAYDMAVSNWKAMSPEARAAAVARGEYKADGTPIVGTPAPAAPAAPAPAPVAPLPVAPVTAPTAIPAAPAPPPLALPTAQPTAQPAASIDTSTPQGIAKLIYTMAVERGYSDSDARAIVAYAVGESSLNPRASGDVQRLPGEGGSDAEHEVIGLFQQKPAFAREGGIDPAQRANPYANVFAYLNQLEKNRNLPIEQALPETSGGGPLAGGAARQNWEELLKRANGYLGGSPISTSNPVPVQVINMPAIPTPGSTPTGGPSWAPPVGSLPGPAWAPPVAGSTSSTPTVSAPIPTASTPPKSGTFSIPVGPSGKISVGGKASSGSISVKPGEISGGPDLPTPPQMTQPGTKLPDREGPGDERGRQADRAYAEAARQQEAVFGQTGAAKAYEFLANAGKSLWEGIKSAGEALASTAHEPAVEPRTSGSLTDNRSGVQRIGDWAKEQREKTWWEQNYPNIPWPGRDAALAQGMPQLAVGGPVFGAGTATSDSIPAWLSNGEFVHKADAVDHYGVDFMHAVNQKKLPKFNTGGRVDTTGAQVDTIGLAEAVAGQFGVSDIHLYRGPDGYNEHSSGQAADFMVSQLGVAASNEEIRTGNLLNLATLGLADKFGVMYTIWQNKMWYPGGTSKPYGADPKDATQAHKDHVHARTRGGGYPEEGGPGSLGVGDRIPSGMSKTPAANASSARFINLPGFAGGGEVDGGKNLQKQLLLAAFQGKGGDGAAPETNGLGVIGDFMAGEGGGWKEKLSTGVSNALSGSFWLGKAGVDTDTEKWSERDKNVPIVSDVSSFISRITGGDGDGRMSWKDIVDLGALPDAVKEAGVIGSDESSLMEKGLSTLAMAAFIPGGKAVSLPTGALERLTPTVANASKLKLPKAVLNQAEKGKLLPIPLTVSPFGGLVEDPLLKQADKILAARQLGIENLETVINYTREGVVAGRALPGHVPMDNNLHNMIGQAHSDLVMNNVRAMAQGLPEGAQTRLSVPEDSIGKYGDSFYSKEMLVFLKENEANLRLYDEMAAKLSDGKMIDGIPVINNKMLLESLADVDGLDAYLRWAGAAANDPRTYYRAGEIEFIEAFTKGKRLGTEIQASALAGPAPDLSPSSELTPAGKAQRARLGAVPESVFGPDEVAKYGDTGTHYPHDLPYNFKRSLLGEPLMPGFFKDGGLAGGKLPGFGGGDTIPIMAEGGEFIVNKNSTSKFLPVLHAINDGNIPGFQNGGQLNTQGAQVNTIAVAEAVKQNFGVTDIGMYRHYDGIAEHSSGRAADVMVGLGNPLGDAINAYVLQNAEAFGVQSTIWKQHYFTPGGTPSKMEDRGTPTQNHMDHVHILTSGGGFLQGQQGGDYGKGSVGKPESKTPSMVASAFLSSTGLSSQYSGGLGAAYAPQVSSSSGYGGAGSFAGVTASPFPGLPSGFDPGVGSPEYRQKYMQWYMNQQQAQTEITQSESNLAEATAEEARKRQEAAAATKTYTDMRNQWNEMSAAEQANQTDFYAKLEEAYKTMDTQNRNLANAQQALTSATNRRTLAYQKAQIESTKEAPTMTEDIKPDKLAQQFGAGLIKGMFQSMGFPDVFGKPITEWGAYKMAMGGLGYGAGLLQNMTQFGPGNQIQGMPVAGAQPQAQPGSNLLGFITGAIPQAAPLAQNHIQNNAPQPHLTGNLPGPAASVTPAMAASQAPVGAPGQAVTINSGTQIIMNGTDLSPGQTANNLVASGFVPTPPAPPAAAVPGAS